MSNKASTSLHKLIHSLSKAEKRYFKVYTSRNAAGSENAYHKLFNAIDRQKVYDEDALMKKFAKEAFVNRFSITKNRLYSSILKSLDAYHSTSSLDPQIHRQLHYVEILFKKSMYDESRKLLNSAKKQALKHERIHLLSEINRWDKLLMEKGSYITLGKKELKQILVEDLALLQKEAVYNEIWYAKSRIFRTLYKRGHARSKEDVARFKKIIKDLKVTASKAESTAASQFLYQHAMSAYHYALGEYLKSYRLLNKNLELIKEQNHLFRDEPNLYFTVLTNVINVAMKLGKTDAALQHLDELEELPSTELMNQGEDTDIRIFGIAGCTKLALFAQSGEFEKGVAILPEIEDGLIKYQDKLSSVRKATFYFNIAVILFGMNQKNEALKWINQLLNHVEFNHTEDIQCMAQMLNLVLHIELGNKALLPYALKSTQRFLESRRKVYRFEEVFLRFVNEMMKKRQAKSENELFQDLLVDLQELKQDPLELAVYEYFNFEAWVKSRLSGTTYAEEHRG